jgi:hypothetical protein
MKAVRRVQRFNAIRQKVKPTNEKELKIKPMPQINKEATIPPENTQKIGKSNPEQEPITKTAVTNQQPVPTEKMSEAVAQDISQSNIHKTEKTLSEELEIISNRPKKKVTCLNCEKTFNTPLFTLDYSEGKSKLVACCPYCNEAIENQNKSVLKSYANEAYANALDFQIKSEEIEEELENNSYLK